MSTTSCRWLTVESPNVASYMSILVALATCMSRKALFALEMVA
jgi:hypothetical protein